MLDFKYCIWFRPKENHLWESYCLGFKPHMSVFTKLNKDEFEYDVRSHIIKYDRLVIEPKSIRIRLKGDVIYEITHGFHSLFYYVECVDPKPTWWPRDAHVSFRYQYDKPFSMEEINQLRSQIKDREAIFERINVVKCSNHYETWEICS